jgi:hypothetical protein
MSESLLSEARAALITAGITGPHQSHPRHKNIDKIHALLSGEDPDATFGLPRVERYSAGEVLSFVAEATGCSADIVDLEIEDTIDPDLTIRGILAGARRLKAEADRGSSLLCCTGHPTGLLDHHMRVVEAYRLAGGKVLRPMEGERFALGRRDAQIRYIGGVGCLSDWGNLRHTHAAEPMEILLSSGAEWPNVVLGDHGFAGAAIARGIPTIAVMDINDPALAVAWAEGKDVVLIPMDDNRFPRLYEPSWEIFEQVLQGNL